MRSISGTAEPHDGVAAIRIGIYASALRCLVTYVVAPATALSIPVAGAAMGSLAQALQALGAAVATAGCITLWQTRHWARVAYTAVTAAVLALALYPLAAAMGGAQ
jgi:hypothetical protein